MWIFAFLLNLKHLSLSSHMCLLYVPAFLVESVPCALAAFFIIQDIIHEWPKPTQPSCFEGDMFAGSSLKN